MDPHRRPEYDFSKGGIDVVLALVSEFVRELTSDGGVRPYVGFAACGGEGEDTFSKALIRWEINEETPPFLDTGAVLEGDCVES